MDRVHYLSKISSGSLYHSYFVLNTLKSLLQRNELIFLQALNPHEDMQRKIALRKVYQRAILTPTHHVEQLWKEYENFENSVNRQLVNFCFTNLVWFLIF